MKVLMAGGAGFIGSTVASACLDDGIVPVILDNLSTGRPEFTRDRIFYHGDIADGPLVDRIFADHPDIEAVVHAAALIVVPESVARPLHYYRENVAKSIDFIDHVVRNGCARYLFSSSAAIYAPAGDGSVDEDSPIEPSSPYARTKAMIEQILADTAAATPLRALSLRYFNPIGADPTMRTGLQLRQPSHALGKLIGAYAVDEEFLITGVDWPTRDGSGIRDYIHVWDLARAHVQALRRFDLILPPAGASAVGSASAGASVAGASVAGADGPVRAGGTLAINLGTGDGTTVRELVAAFRGVVDRPLRVRETGPRPGDQAGSFTRIGRARQLLDWKPELTVADGIRDSLRWVGIRDSRLSD